MRFRALMAVLLAATLAACGSNGGGGGGASAENYPNRNLDWTIAFGPGGGNDIMSRTIVDVLEKEQLYPRDIAVQNLEGGSGAKGWGELFSNRGNPYAISTTSGSFLTTPLQADTGWTWQDFTLVGLFATDNAVFIVSPESGIEEWDQWVESAKSKETVKVGGIGTVNVDYIQHQMLADKAGYKIDYVPYNEEGQLLTSLLSGALDAAVSNPSEVLGQVKADKLTPLLFTGTERLEAMPEVPTAESKGFTGLPTLPRGLILPPDVPEEVRQWWIDTMKQVVETPAWQEYIEENALVADVRWGDDFSAYMDETGTKLENQLRELGAL
ncbi:MAG TPA: tripartite tricarboxylate transporter substrate-binding protein [Solirubrobacteraceae bacterium]|nr:tripartite tricarboxylate transporter substrate-binding protein [Solirubrobacteraceae bacterium]